MKTTGNNLHRMTIPLSLGMILALASVLTPAQTEPGDAPPPGPGRRMERMIEGLDLTAAQEAAVKDLFRAHHDMMWDGREQMRAARTVLHERIHSGDFDEVAIREAAAAVAAIEADRAVERARLQRQLREILSPEQMDQLREMHRERRGRFGECMEGGFGPHGPHGHPGRHGRGPGPRHDDTY